MTKSETINELAQALLRVQKQLLPTVKDARNAFVGNTYATLNAVMESCREALFSQGILLTQLPCSAPAELGPGHIGLETMLTHTESGEWISSVAVIPLPKSDPQGMGSAITYARRYSLCAILGIVTEDDDGEAAKVPVQRQAGARNQGQMKQSEKAMPPSSLPNLDGVTYRTVQADDGRSCIVASGRTQEKKALLSAAGFRWNPKQKVWWRYADAA